MMSNESISDETALLAVSCAAAINQQLYDLLALLNEQTRVLKRLIGKQIRPTNDERRRLAALARTLERRVLVAHELIVTVDTLHRWYRQLIATTYTAKKTGRPRINPNTEALIVRMATDNPSWGADAIRDRLMNVGITITDRTVANVLRRHGIPPAPQRAKTNQWKRFIEAHWPHLVALDFATFEVPQGNRTRRHHALYAINIATREVQLVGVTDHADGSWMLNMARKLTDPNDGFVNNMHHVIMDRDPLFTDAVRTCFRSIGCEPKILPTRSPNLNAYIERFIGTVRYEIGKRIIPLSTAHLEHVLTEHVAYYNHERNHQRLPKNQMPDPCHATKFTTNDPINVRSRLGKTLNFYYREAV